MCLVHGSEKKITRNVVNQSFFSTIRICKVSISKVINNMLFEFLHLDQITPIMKVSNAINEAHMKHILFCQLWSNSVLCKQIYQLSLIVSFLKLKGNDASFKLNADKVHCAIASEPYPFLSSIWRLHFINEIASIACQAHQTRAMDGKENYQICNISQNHGLYDLTDTH